jgi:hypothetical protein
VKIVRRVVGVIVVLAVLTAVAKTEQGSTKKAQKVVQIGNSQVAIPNSTPRGIFAVTMAMFAKTAYLPSYQDCMMREARRLLTPTQAMQLMRLPAAEREQRGMGVLAKAQPHCYRPGQTLVNPNATHAQLTLIRAQTALTLKAEIAGSNLSQSKKSCAVAQINKMPDAVLIELANGTTAVKSAVVNRILRPCEGS